MHVLVVENGSTLSRGESASGNVEIIYNPTNGDSGGYTRGMIDFVRHGTDDDILLMVDDIVFVLSLIERCPTFIAEGVVAR